MSAKQLCWAVFVEKGLSVVLRVTSERKAWRTERFEEPHPKCATRRSCATCHEDVCEGSASSKPYPVVEREGGAAGCEVMFSTELEAEALSVLEPLLPVL